MIKTIGFLGCGNMGGAIARAVCKAADPQNVYLANRTAAKAEALAAELGCNTTTNAEVAGRSDLIFLAVKPQMKVIGPRFKDRSSKIIKALGSMDPAQAAEQKASGRLKVEVDAESYDLPAEAVEIETETLSAGLAVDILRLDGASVLVRR